jgi:hypothetical protein
MAIFCLFCFFVCSLLRQERTVFVLSVTALVQHTGSGDAVEYSGSIGRSVLSEVGRRVGLVPSHLRFIIPKPAPFWASASGRCDQSVTCTLPISGIYRDNSFHPEVGGSAYDVTQNKRFARCRNPKDGHDLKHPLWKHVNSQLTTLDGVIGTAVMDPLRVQCPAVTQHTCM